MSNMDTNLRVMLKACDQFYRRGLTHTEIAANLGVTRFTVARMLRAAIEDGFVVVKILEPESWHHELEREIEERYGLRAALIVDNDQLDEEEAKLRVADAAGRYLLETIADRDVLGVSLGTTTQALVDQLPSRVRSQVEVVQLIGGDSTILSMQLADRSRTRPHLLHAPAVVSGKKIRELLLAEESIRSTFEMFRKVSIAVVGIGSLTAKRTSRLLYGGIIDARLRQGLLAQGAVGDVLSYVFDQDGKVVKSGLEDRLIVIPLEEYRRIPLRIGVAAGKAKAAAIAAALKGGFVNVIVLDSVAAEAIRREPPASENRNRPG